MTQNPPEGSPYAQKPTLGQRFEAGPVTFVLAAINVAYFVWIEQHGGSSKPEVLLRFGAVEPIHVRLGEYWRLASYMFVHIGWAHLLLNTWAGSTWSLVVEPILGHRRFLFVYLLGGLGGGIACACFSTAVTSGASGALFGMLGATLAIRGRILGDFSKFLADRMVRSTVAQVAIWVVLGATVLPMSNAGHIGGLVTGGVATSILLPAKRRTAAWIAFAIVFLAFLGYAVRPLSRGVDFANIKISRLGGIENEDAVKPALEPACKKGIERACIMHALLSLDLQSKANTTAAYQVFDRGCQHGDADACCGVGILVMGGFGVEPDLERGAKVLHDACAAGSEYACEWALN